MPLIHRARYHAWARQADKTEACTALQCAMRTLAAAASAPLQQLSCSLYTDTRQVLENLDRAAEQDPTDDALLEHIQAWLLLAHYEFLRKPYRQALMTAGRAYRMVQIAQLHQIDEPNSAPGHDGAGPESSWLETEQKRRTFWVAYCLDRCTSLHGGCPHTFHEDAVRDTERLFLAVPECER